MNNDMTYKIIYKVIEIWDKDIEAESYEEAIVLAAKVSAQSGRFCASNEAPIEIQLGSEEPRSIINGKLS